MFELLDLSVSGMEPTWMGTFWVIDSLIDPLNKLPDGEPGMLGSPSLSVWRFVSDEGFSPGEDVPIECISRT